jgi:hypothetical protein
VPGEGHLDGLAGGGEQEVGPAQVEFGAAGGAAGQVDQRPRGERPRLPQAVTGGPQHPDRPSQVVQRFGVAAENPQRDAPPHQDARRWRPADQREGGAQRGQTAPAVTAVDQRHAERGEHIGLPQRAAVDIRHRQDTVTVEADDLGRFRSGPFPPGPASLRLRPPPDAAGPAVVTDWIAL